MPVALMSRIDVDVRPVQPCFLQQLLRQCLYVRIFMAPAVVRGRHEGTEALGIGEAEQPAGLPQVPGAVINARKNVAMDIRETLFIHLRWYKLHP